jgi:hypothetical protein
MSLVAGYVERLSKMRAIKKGRPWAKKNLPEIGGT